MIKKDSRTGSRLLQTSLVEEPNLSNLQAQWQVSIGQGRMQVKLLTIFLLEVVIVLKVDLLEQRETSLLVVVLR